MKQESSILAIQGKKGIGDGIIYLPFIFYLAKKFNSPVSLLAQKNTRAEDLLKTSPFIKEVITLDRDDKNKSGRHYGIKGTFNLIKDLKEKNFSKSFTFNSSYRYAFINRLAGIKERYQYPLGEKKNQNIIEAAKAFIFQNFEENIESNPKLTVENKVLSEIKNKYEFKNDKKHILLGCGGSGKTKRIRPEKFVQFMDLIEKDVDCRFIIAAGSNDEEQKIVDSIINSEHNCIPINKMDIANPKTLAIIKNCDLACCTDSSFSHIAASLDVPTITIVTDTPMVYVSYHHLMHPVLPEGLAEVTHNTLGAEKINPKDIYIKAKKILNL